MSLRFRLILLVTLLSLVILALGSLFVVNNARRAVFDEIQSTANLTRRLLDLALTPGSEEAIVGRLDRLADETGVLDGIRHLRLALIDGSGETPIGTAAGSDPRGRAPAWYARLVAPPELEFRQAIGTAATDGGHPAELLIRTDPTDEIDESWRDARSVLGLVIGFLVLANAIFWFAIGRWLAPLARFDKAFEGIEHGDYSARLPSLDLPELDALAGKFNHMAATLEASRRENRELTERSLAIQEHERRFLAQELHDEFGQSLSAIRAVAAAMESGGDRAEVIAGAETIATVAGRMYAVVTGMIRRLRPVRLDEFGLVAALEDLVDGWNDGQADGFCSLTTEGELDRLGEAIDIGIYRIVQESLTNAGKHARATSVRIELTRRGNAIELSIADDGVGFDPATTTRGLGLPGIRERVEAMQGGFRLETSAGRGVSLRIHVPLSPRTTASARLREMVNEVRA
jgi:two-component system sensor histidine kinase UhpB